MNASQSSSQASPATKELSAPEAQTLRARFATENMPRAAVMTKEAAPTPSASKPAPEVALLKRDTDGSMSKRRPRKDACDFCYVRKLQCFGGPDEPQCENCAKVDVMCTNGGF